MSCSGLIDTMRSHRVTLDRIAKEAGVSYMTVARALSGKTKAVWPRTARRNARIRAIAERLGYRANSAARATVTGRFGAVAFVMRAEWSDFFPFDLFRSVCDTLAASDMHMVAARIERTKIEDEAYAPKIVREFSVDGLLIHEAVDIAPEVTTMIQRHRVPAVWVNAKLPHDCVFPDEIEGTARATRWLLKRGHKKILYLSYETAWDGPPHYSHGDRLEGFVQAMKSAGLPPWHERVGYPAAPLPAHGRPWGLNYDDRLARATALLKRPDRPSAVLSPSPETSLPLLYAAAQLGIAVPGQLSIVAVNHEPIAEWGRALTILRTPMADCGRLAVEMLMRKIARPSTLIPALPVAFGDPEGHTAGPPASV